MAPKKIFIYFALTPVLIALILEKISSIFLFPWVHENINQIGVFVLVLAGFVCLYLLIGNFKKGSLFWYLFPGFIIFVFWGYAYFIYSLSNFGF